jgi:hypothetical protein
MCVRVNKPRPSLIPQQLYTLLPPSSDSSSFLQDPFIVLHLRGDVGFLRPPISHTTFVALFFDTQCFPCGSRKKITRDMLSLTQDERKRGFDGCRICKVVTIVTCGAAELRIDLLHGPLLLLFLRYFRRLPLPRKKQGYFYPGNKVQ